MVATSLVSALLLLVLIVAICYVCFWLIDAGFPPPLTVVAKILVGVLGLIAIWQYVLPVVGLH